ncbi:MAG: hypothetical protein P8N94_06635 [Gammaproteobacteria bacterium]|nr:hypothetical protein [Gammaproteobacteria bacterium]
MPFSLYYEKKILGKVFGNEAISFATNGSTGSLYIGLSTSTPTENDASSDYNFDEPTGNNYSRKMIQNTTGSGASDTWAAAAGDPHGEVSNRIAITFPTASGGTWGTISHFGIFDHSSDDGPDHLIAWAALSANKTVGDGDTASFAIGQLKIKFS